MTPSIVLTRSKRRNFYWLSMERFLDLILRATDKLGSSASQKWLGDEQ